MDISPDIEIPSILFKVTSFIRDNHIYKEIWTPIIGDDSLFCQRENENPHDENAVSVMHNNVRGSRIVGYVPSQTTQLNVPLSERELIVDVVMDSKCQMSILFLVT